MEPKNSGHDVCSRIGNQATGNSTFFKKLIGIQKEVSFKDSEKDIAWFQDRLLRSIFFEIGGFAEAQIEQAIENRLANVFEDTVFWIRFNVGLFRPS